MSLLMKLFIGLIGSLLIVTYFITNSQLYRMTQLDHLDDRIRFGRLQFHRKANYTLGNIQIHNIQKIFTIKFHGDQIFVGKMEQFLIFMETQGSIKQNGDGIFRIDDQIKKICKIQRILNIYVFQQNNTIQIQGNFLDCPDANYKLSLTETGYQKLIIKLQASQKYKRVYMLFNNQQNTQFYGLGEQFSYLNLGQNRPFSTFTREKGIGRGQQPLTLMSNFMYGAGGSYFTSYAPAPIWISSKKIAYILNSHHYMAWINNKILVWSNNFSITYLKSQNYKTLIKSIAQINGYTPSVPNWVNEGAILGAQGGPDKVLRKYKDLKKAGADISGLWIHDWISKKQSLGYSKLWWNWQVEEEHYKNWDQLKKLLKQDNVKVLIYINPMLSDITKKSSITKNNYQIAKEMGYFVKLKNGQQVRTDISEGVTSSLIDFNNQEAVKFFKHIIEGAIRDTQASGMMVDCSEVYPVESVSSTIQEGVQRHNQYPNIYYEKLDKIVKDVLKDQNRNFYIFTRAGHLNTPQYAHSLWTGDQSMNFNFHTGLPSCLTAILSSGLVGYSNTHCDIGGYIHYQSDYLTFTHRTEILLLRWMQLSAFTSVFRTNQGSLPQSTFQVYSNQYLSRIFAFYSGVFKILAPYRQQQIKNSLDLKLPLVRPLFLQLEGVEGTQNLQDQFFLGSQIYVAPFMSQESQRKYFLPKGEWFEIWSGKIFKGCDCQRVWKDILPAVFVRSSSSHSQNIMSQISKQMQRFKDVVFVIPKTQQEQL